MYGRMQAVIDNEGRMTKHLLNELVGDEFDVGLALQTSKWPL